MLGFIAGTIVGLLAGWNLLPQPAWVLRIYDRLSDRLIRWIQSWVVLIVCLSIAGCNSIPGISQPESTYPWKQRAMAEIAIASVTSSPNVAPDVKPAVGSRCPDCNDPPGECGVGKTGDGQVCDRCKQCNGDGRIDEADLRSESDDLSGDVGESVVETQKEIALHITRSNQKAWANDWYLNKRKEFEDAGWFVRLILEPDNSIETAYFDVITTDGKVENFFEPLTPKMLEHLETR